MTISVALVEAIKRRTDLEAGRTSYPVDFPALPPVPARRYSDPTFAALEIERVFGRTWLMVAHIEELPEPGSYRLVEQLAAPIMLVHGQDGMIRAFYNTCKHRGAALVAQRAGNVGRRLTCPYHNWVYSLDGQLLGYPSAEDFTDLDRDCLALTSIRCETWGPLVFINLSDDAPDLEEFLGSVGSDLDEIADLAGRLHLVDHTTRAVPVNWKIPVDANIETYHVNYVHKDTAARALHQPATGIQLLRHGHSRMLIRTHEGVTVGTPMAGVFEGLGDLPSSGTFSYHVFPNLSIVFVGGAFVFFITNWPDGTSTSTYHVHWCASAASDDPEHGDFLRRFVESNQRVLFEDLDVLPGIQRSVDAGAIDSFQLSYQERRIYHLHEAIDRAIGIELVPDQLRVPQVLGPHAKS